MSDDLFEMLTGPDDPHARFWHFEACLDGVNRIQLIVEAVKDGLFTWQEARAMIPLEDRLKSYAGTGFPEALFQAADGRIVGTWIMGNNYRVKSSYHGGYPPTYLKRIAAMFPDRWNTLHLFSGKVDTDEFPGDTVDINPANNPTWVDDAQTLTRVPVEKYDLVLADPPYTDEDSNKYGTTPIKRNLIMQVLGNRLQPGAFIVWLDQALPMYRKDQFDMVGCIGMYKSTNHRIRGVTIFRKKILTEIQNCVNLSIPAGDTGTNTNPNEIHMNPKLLTLLFTIGATALTQMANACSGGGEAPAGGKPAKPGKPAKSAEPEATYTAPDADDNDDDPTAGGDDDDNDDTEKVDYDALRKTAKKKVAALFEADAANKKKVKAILDSLGEANIGDMDNDNLPKFITKLNKLK